MLKTPENWHQMHPSHLLAEQRRRLAIHLVTGLACNGGAGTNALSPHLLQRSNPSTYESPSCYRARKDSSDLGASYIFGRSRFSYVLELPVVS